MRVEDIKQIVQELPEQQAKTFLYHILLRINQMKETQHSEELVDSLKEMYQTILHLKGNVENPNRDKAYKKVHILFGLSPAGCLKVVLNDLGIGEEDQVIAFPDIFSIGPIWNLQNENGLKNRIDWIESHFSNKDHDLNEYVESFRKALRQIDDIPSSVSITIWSGENAHEQTGLRFVLYLLRIKDNDVAVINTTKVFTDYFNRPNLKYVLLHSGEISPEKMKVIYEKNIANPPLSTSERNRLEEEWTNLSANNEVLRIWRNGQIDSVKEDFYDQYIIEQAKKLHRKRETRGFMKSSRIIGEVLGHLEQYVGDEFLEYRLRTMIENGIFDVEGSLEAMRYYSVKLL